MTGFNDNRDGLGLEVLPDAVGHLRGQPFLHLKPARKAMEHARELADADHLVVGQIGDRSLADDRRKVVLAMRLKRNVLEKDDLVVAADLVEGAAQVDGGVFSITL